MRLSQSQLPRVLIIDDQFGRCSLGHAFHEAVGADLFHAYQADRENLCRIYGILDGSGDCKAMSQDSCIVTGVFCPGQRWNSTDGVIENDLDLVRGTVRRGWPFKDGSRWALVLLDIRFVHGKINEFGDPQTGSKFGLDEILPMLRKEYGEDLPVVVLSSTPKDKNNATARTGGALDFIQRVPGVGATPEEGREALQKALFTHGLIEDETGGVVGKSLATLKMLRQAKRGAMAARNILLLGETGSGKGLLAQYIHRMSTRASAPFETFHAAHRPADLQADELFGHWKGAFTGAVGDSPGIWERANGGTVFIDELADIDIKVQQALMQPIEERKVRRVGTPPKEAAEPKQVDVLVVLATNRDLHSAAAAGAFKSDFLNRINAFTIEIPPLRERREDIPLLIKQLTAAVAPNWQGKILPDAMEALISREWRDGNIRELRNVLERAIANNPGQDITAADVTMGNTTFGTTQIDTPVVPQSKPCLALAEALLKDLRQRPLAQIEDMKRDLSGRFPELIAELLAMALHLTQANGKLNPSAAARFLLGNPNLTTLQAKQFLKRLLMLDTKNNSVAKAFNELGLSEQHNLLASIMTQSMKNRKQTEPPNVTG